MRERCRSICNIYKRERSGWDAPKLRQKLIKITSRYQHHPRRAGSPRPGQASQTPPLPGAGAEVIDARSPNAFWCADNKGQFRLGNRRYCYPLTITDYRSQYLFACEALESTASMSACGRSLTRSGLSASCTMNQVSSTKPSTGWSQWAQTHSLQKC